MLAANKLSATGLWDEPLEARAEGEMEGLHSLLHSVSFFSYFPFQVLSVLFTKPTD
jgi:hypothetical protein